MKEQVFEHLMSTIDEIELTFKENQLYNALPDLLNLRLEIIRDHYHQNH